jgi:hypothetical protein
MSPARLIIDTRERVYQHIKDSPDGLTEKGVFDAIEGQPSECQGERCKMARRHGRGRYPTCPDCQGTGCDPRGLLAPWLVHACLGYLLAEARIIDTSDDATEYRWVVLGV